MAQKGPVEFKGKLNGLYLNLDADESFDTIIKFLRELLVNRASFYQGSRIIGVKGRSISYKEKAILETIIYDEFGITVESLEDPDSTSNSRNVEVDHQTVATEPEKTMTPTVEKEIVEKIVYQTITETKPRSLDDTKFVFGTLRSGKSVHYPGHVVVIGDVNPGAEIVAEGNIIVIGRVLGFIHAGSAGDEKAIIIANVLKPTQIRISTFISVPPSDDDLHHANVPEKASVCEGVIKIEKCH